MFSEIENFEIYKHDDFCSFCCFINSEIFSLTFKYLNLLKNLNKMFSIYTYLFIHESKSST